MHLGIDIKILDGLSYVCNGEGLRSPSDFLGFVLGDADTRLEGNLKEYVRSGLESFIFIKGVLKN